MKAISSLPKLDKERIPFLSEFFLDNKFIAIIDILLSILLDKMVMKFGLKIPSGGIIAILTCLNQTQNIDILGISLLLIS